MNIQQLQYIIALDRFRNFTKASESCFITQATMSTMIRKLEDELGVILFDRKSNPILTTDIGKEIIAEARLALQHIQHITELSKDESKYFEGSVQIGIIPTIANSLLPLILKPILKDFPKLEIGIQEITTDNVLEELKNNRIDFGIISTPISQPHFDIDVLYYEPLKVYGKTQNHKKYLLSSDVQNERHWLLEDGHCIRDQIMHYCSLKNKNNPIENLKFQSNSFDTLINMVDTFGGLTIIPELYAHSLSNEQKQHIQEFEKPTPVREVSLVSYRSEIKTPIRKMLIDKIKSLVNFQIDLKEAVVLQRS